MTATKKNKTRRQNALVHGLYAKDVLLPWDSKDDFEKLHADLTAEFMPHGRAEEEAVLDLTFLHWHKHSLRRMWQTAVLKDPFTRDILGTEGKSWSAIRKRLRSAAESEGTLLGTVEASVTKMFLQVNRLRKEMDAATDREVVKAIEEKMNAVMLTVGEHAAPLLQKLREGPDAERAFNSAYAPESMETIVRLEAALDARIAKVLARLVGLKEFKRTPAAGTRAALTNSP